MIPYLLCFLLFSIGLYGILRKRNIVKIIIGIVVCEYAVNLFFILFGYRAGGRAPLFSPGEDIPSSVMVDPLVQALVLTAIVIGLASTALLVGVAIRIYEKYGTFDITKIRNLRG